MRPHHFGYPSLTAFLEQRCRMASGRAHRLVARSRVFRSARTTFRAWTAGRLSTDQAGVLLDQATALPDHYAEGEDRLVDIVEDLGVTDTRRALEYWRQTVDGPGRIRDQLEQMELRGISASKSLGGMIRVDGWMTTTAGLAFLAALEALMPPPLPGDTRTLRQRRHDALEDLARHFLDHGDTPTVGGESPTSIWCAIYLPSKASLVGSTRPRPAISSPSWSSGLLPATARSAGSCSALTARPSMSAGAPESSPPP
ncbi:MAG: DUF222 domain-containing protein [Acidimicrobiia bacterium]